jgi:hypothetical protein
VKDASSQLRNATRRAKSDVANKLISMFLHEPPCPTCQYWRSIWANDMERRERLGEILLRIQSFRSTFSEFEQILPNLTERLPALLTKLYADCQSFAETEIKALLERFHQTSTTDR